MATFHLFTVNPADVAVGELPRVQMGDYIVIADSLQSAFETILGREWPERVVTACEVWGRELAAEGATVPLNPATSRNQQTMLSTHVHWTRINEGYQCLHRGPVSLDQWRHDRFHAQWKERRPFDAPVTQGAALAEER